MILSEPEETATKCQGDTKLASSTCTWVKCERLSLSVSDRDEIVDGLQLSDKHINFAQKIIKCQFSLQGLQSTLLQTTSKPSVNELQIVHSRDNHWIVASTLITNIIQLVCMIHYMISSMKKALKSYDTFLELKRFVWYQYRSNKVTMTVDCLQLHVQCIWQRSVIWRWLIFFNHR